MDSKGAAGSAPETRPVASPGTLGSRVSLTLADSQVLKLSQPVQATSSQGPARAVSLKAERNLAVFGKLPSMKKGTLTKTSSKIVFPGVLPDGAQSSSPSHPPGTAGPLEGKSRTTKGSGQFDSVARPATGSGNIALQQNVELAAPVNRYPMRPPVKNALRALKHMEVKRRGGKGLMAADAEPNSATSGPRRFVYERMRSHLQDAAANAAEAWAAGMAEGLARFRTRTAAAKPEEENSKQEKEGKKAAKKDAKKANTPAARSAAYEKRRMQRQVAHKLGLNGENNAGGDGEAGGGESAADIMKKLWTVENLLTVETEWFRRKEKHQTEQGESASKSNGLGSFRKHRKEVPVPKKNFDLSDVYNAVQNTSDFDFSEDIPVDAPPPSRLVYLSQTVMSGVDGFSKQGHGYPLDLEALPEEAAEILEASTCDMEAQLQAMGQQATHIVLDAMAMAVLDMKTVDATIESICEQVPYPTNSVIPGLFKMNMLRFVYYHDTLQWRIVLREYWMHAATQPGAVAGDTQLNRTDVLGILATAYDLSGQAQRDIETQDIVFAQDMKGFEVKSFQDQLKEFETVPSGTSGIAATSHKSSPLKTEQAPVQPPPAKKQSTAATLELEETKSNDLLDPNSELYLNNYEDGSVASSLEVDEDTVTFKKAHPLAGTVFYDKFKDTGDSIERRRDGNNNVIELLRDVNGTLLAIAFPVWDPVSQEYVREVSEIDNAVRVNVPLKRKAVIRKKKEPEPEDEPVHEAGTEEAPAEGSEHSPGDEDAEEDGFTQVQYVPDGHGGFFEIFDDTTQGGLFAVNAIKAHDLKSCLEGQGVNYDDVKMLFADGVNAEEAAQLREQATKEVSKQPEAVGLLQSLLDEALRFDGTGAADMSWGPGFEGEGDGNTPTAPRLMMVDPSPKSSCVEDPAGTQNEDTGEEGEDKNGSQAEDGTDGMSDGSGVDETGSPRRGKGRKGRSIGGRKNQDGQDLEGSEEEHSGTQIEDNWEAENTEDRLDESDGSNHDSSGASPSVKDAKRKSSKSAAAKDSNATTPRGNRRHSEPSRRKSSKSASQAKKTRSKRSKSQGDTHTRKERTGEDGEELSDWSDESSCEEDEDGSQGETYSDSWEGNSQEESEDINTATGYTGPDAAAEDAGASQNDVMGPDEMDAVQQQKLRRRKKKKKKSSKAGEESVDRNSEGSSDSSYSSHEYDEEELEKLDPETLARHKRYLAHKESKANRRDRERASRQGGNVDEESGSGDGGAASRSNLRSRGSNATSVNLRGVRDRSKQHPNESRSESSSEAGSLQFDQFLDAQGSDEEDPDRPREKGRKSRGKSYADTLRRSKLSREEAEVKARMSAVELAQRPKFNPYATRSRGESAAAAGFSSDPYQDPGYGTSRVSDHPAGRKSMTSTAGEVTRYSVAANSVVDDRGNQGGGTSAAPWRAAGMVSTLLGRRDKWEADEKMLVGAEADAHGRLTVKRGGNTVWRVAGAFYMLQEAPPSFT